MRNAKRISLVSILFFSLLLPAIFAIAPQTAIALSTNWTGTTGDWHDSLNWDNGVPTLDDYAYIDNDGQALIGTGDAFSHYLYLGDTTGNTGEIVQSGGSLTMDVGLYLGTDPGAQGTYRLSDGIYYAGHTHVGHAGEGYFYQSGGEHNAYSLDVAYWVGSYGRYEMTGGRLVLSELNLGEWGGSGYFIQNGGGVEVTGGSVRLGWGREGYAYGSYELHDGTLSAVSSNLRVGLEYDGHFLQTGGLVNVTGDLYVGGYYKGGNGTYEMQGGIISGVDDLYIGGDTLSGTSKFLYTAGVVNARFLYMTEHGYIDDTGATLDSGDGFFVESLLNRSEQPSNFSLVHTPVHLTGADGTITMNSEYRGAEWSGWNDNFALGKLVMGDGEGGDEHHVTLGSNLYAYGVHLHSDAIVDLNNKIIFYIPDGVEYNGVIGTGFVNDGGTYSNGLILPLIPVHNTLTLGLNPGDDETYTLNNGDVLGTSNPIIGYSGIGTFHHLGGHHDACLQLYIGYAAGGEGTYELDDGMVLAGETYVGRRGSGTFSQTGGFHRVSSAMYIGKDAGGTGVYELISGTLSGDAYVGYYGTGHFIQTGGEFTGNTDSESDCLNLGQYAGAEGTYELWGGRIEKPFVNVGVEGTGHFIQSGGEHLISDTLLVGGGDYELVDGILNSAKVIVDSPDDAHFIQTGGEFTVGNLEIGRYHRNGSFELTGGSLICHGVSLTYSNTGYASYFVQTGGELTTDYFGIESLGTYDLSAGTVSIGQSFSMVGNARTRQAGGELTTNNFLIRQTSTYELTGGTLDVRGDIKIEESAYFDDTGSVFAAGEGIWLGGHYTNESDESAPFSLIRTPICLNGARPEENPQTLNSGSEQRGPIWSGWDENFALGNVVFGEAAGIDTHHFRLESDMYVYGVELHSETVLDLDSYVIFYIPAGTEYNGVTGTGFVNGGGTYKNGLIFPVMDNVVYQPLVLGQNPGDDDTYIINSGNRIGTLDPVIGNQGKGTCLHIGGDHHAVETLYIGYASGSEGAYELGDGVLFTDITYVGKAGTGTFTQTSGWHRAFSFLYIGYEGSGLGTYELTDGTLITGSTILSQNGRGQFIQSGGTHIVRESLKMGNGLGACATYQLSDGTLEAGEALLGGAYGFTTAVFSQTGGQFTVANQLLLGVGTGIYEFSGGVLSIGGQLKVNDKSYITDIGASGQQPIICLGGDFNNSSQQRYAFSLTHSTLNLLGGVSGNEAQTLLAGSEDRGADWSGYDNNFAFGTLIFEGGNDGHELYYQLNSDVYTYELMLHEWAHLDLNGYNLYYVPVGVSTNGRTISHFLLEGTWENGEILAIGGIPIPEPSTLLLLAPGLVGVLGGLRRRRRAFKQDGSKAIRAA